VTIISNLIRPSARWRSLLLLAGGALVLGAVACSSDDPEPTAVPPAPTAVPTAASDAIAGDAMMDDGDAMMSDGSEVPSDISGFQLQTLSISVGDTITWTNQDNAPHTVSHGLSPDVESSPIFQSGNFSKDGTFSHTFVAAGTFAYFCEVHPSMVGSITVGRGTASSGIADPGGDPGY
jgi:plastocyanin